MIVQPLQIRTWTTPITERTRAKRRVRDAYAVELVKTFGALTREQIQHLLFRFPSGDEKCRQRLRVLWKQGKLKRGRCDVTDSYAYWVEKPKQLEHCILVNWVLIKYLPSLKLAYREYITPHLRADALLILESGVYFVEVHRSARFDKVPKYTALLEDEEAWVHEWWAGKQKKKFPGVIVVSDFDLSSQIQEQNKYGIRFQVHSSKEVIDSCLQNSSDVVWVR